MDVVYAAGGATAATIHSRIPEPPVPAAVRTMLRILEDKGHLRHEKDGPRHVYYPTTPRTVAVVALLDDADRPLTTAERSELAGVIKRLRAEGK